MKVGNPMNACFSWKTNQGPVKNSIYKGPQIKFAAEKLQHFFAVCGWKMLLVAPELSKSVKYVKILAHETIFCTIFPDEPNWFIEFHQEKQ